MTSVLASGTVNTVGAGSADIINADVFDSGIYQLYLDLGEMDAGDELKVILGTSINGTTTFHDTIVRTFTGPQGEAVKALPPIVTLQGLSLDYTQPNGAAFNFDYRLDVLGVPSYLNSGRQLTVIGTNHTLATITGVASSPYVLVASFDLNNSGPSDLFTMTVYIKTLNSSSAAAVLVEQISGSGLVDRILQLPPIDVPYQAVITLRQVAGNPQNVDWLLVSI